MESIIEYRDDQAATNGYPRRIVSPTAPSPCCTSRMERIGRPTFDAGWRFYYKRCGVCGYTVRCFYAPRILAILEAAREIRLALAGMNLGTGKRRRRTQAQIAAELIAAGYPLDGRGGPPGDPLGAPRSRLRRARRSLMPLRPRKPLPSPA